jgi:hypothetical protein
VSEDVLLAVGIALSVCVALVLAAGAVLVVRDTVRGRGRWGVNPRPVRCPECGEPAPAVRRPTNRRQALWGGGTCERCGTEYDKWGHRVIEPGAGR